MNCIKPAKAEHRSQIVPIWHAGWHDAHAKLVPKDILKFRTVAFFWRWLEQVRDRFYVALHDDVVVGFVTTNEQELVKLYVAEEARGAGTASALLSHAEDMLRDDSVVEGVLYCTAGNTRAQSFYKRENWILRQTFPDKLWLPKGEAGEYFVDTHRYTKRLI